MSIPKVKIFDPKGEKIKYTNGDNWEVMKPFVKFSFKTIKVIGLALIAIVSALPLLKSRHNNSVEKRG
jgi:hypothetical protein